MAFHAQWYMPNRTGALSLASYTSFRWWRIYKLSAYLPFRRLLCRKRSA